MKKFKILTIIFLFTLIFSVSACGHEHSFGEWTTTTTATCTTKGTQSRFCDCGEEQTQDIPKLSHDWNDWITETQPTCTDSGTKTRTCKICDTEESKTIPENGHDWSDWTTISETTCTEDGLQYRECFCGAREEETITHYGHSWIDATCTTSKYCLTCNTTDGDPLGHTDNGNGYCSVCGDQITIDMTTKVGAPDDCSAISYFGFCYYKNSADGIKVCWGGENLSGKTINYYTVTIYFKNSVGDPAYSEITGKDYKTIKYVGPVAPGEDLLIFSIVDYVPVCSKVIIGEIKLEYADGTTDYGWYGWSTTRRNSSID